jgi:hypothetical protein
VNPEVLMNWKNLMLGSALLAFQTEPHPPAPAREPGAVVVEIGHVPMEGQWFQDGFHHVHDNQVKLTHIYRKNGVLTVTLSNGLASGTDLIFNFAHDPNGSTRAGVTANYRRDATEENAPPSQRLRDLEGRLVLPTNDWGPDKSFTCAFALAGNLVKERQFLLGSFLVVIPK